jgi:hypothetical protein
MAQRREAAARHDRQRGEAERIDESWVNSE